MRLRRTGTGTVRLEGIGEVSHGEEIEVPDALGQALRAEQPTEWVTGLEEERTASGGANHGQDEPRPRRGR